MNKHLLGASEYHFQFFALTIKAIHPSVELFRDWVIIFSALSLLAINTLFAFGIPISQYHLPLLILLSLGVTAWFQVHRSCAVIIMSIFLISLVGALSIWLSVRIIDATWDFRAYHGPATMALVDGWNPLWNWNICNWDSRYCELNERIFMDHYAKGHWYLSTLFYSVFGNIEAGKSLNIYFLAALLYTAFSFSYSLLEKSLLKSLLFSVAVATNPVSLSEITTGYVDGLLASLFSLYAILIIEFIVYGKIKSLILSLLLLPYFITIKLTGVVYAAIFTAGAIGVAYFYDRVLSYRLLITSFIFGILSVLVVGFNPYVTNTLEKGNPFYPAYQPAIEFDFLGDQAIEEFVSRNRFEKFIIANFSVQKSRLEWQIPQWSIPLTRLDTPVEEGTRFSGFGPFFSAVLIIFVLQLFFLRKDIFFLFSLVVIVSVFSTSAAWWSRLAPQMWFAVALVQLGAMVTDKRRIAQIVAVISLILMIGGGFLVFKRVIVDQYATSMDYYHDVVVLKEIDPMPKVRVDGSWYYGGVGNFSFYNTRKIKDETGVWPDIDSACEVTTGNKIFQLCLNF